jgi:hypothetical protein
MRQPIKRALGPNALESPEWNLTKPLSVQGGEAQRLIERIRAEETRSKEFRGSRPAFQVELSSTMFPSATAKTIYPRQALQSHYLLDF